MKRTLQAWFPALVAVLVLLPASARASLGLWSSAAELATLPTSGPEWTAVQTRADQSQTAPDIANQDDPTNIRVLASAIVYARTGNVTYKNKVTNAISILVSGGDPGGRSLAWAREVGAYVLAADLVDYQSHAGNAAFRTWIRNVAETYICEQQNTNMLLMFKDRPNNWGLMAFGSLIAIYAYLEDTAKLNEVRNYFIAGVVGPNPGFVYSSPHTWHVDEGNKRLYNPAGAVKSGVNIDGVIPDDMRRGGGFANPPNFTGYAWEGQQGPIMAARVLGRIGMSIWETGDMAIYRGVYRLQVGWATAYGSQWKAEGDDAWMLPFIDAAYGTNLTSTSTETTLWDAGKNTGFAYVTLADAGSNQVAVPAFNPAAGTYASAQSVTITSATSGASIRYTTNGTNPTSTTGTLYSGPVAITTTTTLKAIAYKSGMTDSAVTTGVYTINLPAVAAPSFNPGGGSYSSAQNVTISTTTSGATIRYTTNGTNPTSTSGTVYSGPVNIASTTTLKAIAYKAGMADSSVTTATYTITVGGGGTFNLIATADSFVQGGSPTTNFNSTAYLRVKNASGDSNDRWTYIKFNLSSVIGTVQTATLKLKLKALTNGSPATAFIYSVATDSWTETGLNWNNRPAVGTLLASNTSLTTVNNVYSFNITSFVAAENTGDRTVTIAIRDDNQVAKAADFYRREDLAADAPTLTVVTQ